MGKLVKQVTSHSFFKKTGIKFMNEKPELNIGESIMTITTGIFQGAVYSGGTFMKIILI